MQNIMKKAFSKLTIASFTLFISLFFTSCHKEISTTNQLGNAYTISYTQIFEDFWNSMNKTYVFWGVDPTNWDQIHNTYAPKFAALDKDSTLTSDSINSLSNSYFKGMVDGLIDSHYFLSLYYTLYGISPSQDRKLKNPVFIENLFQTAPYTPSVDGKFYYTAYIDSLYLDGNKMVGIDTSQTVTGNFYALAGFIQNTHILYFSFNVFQLVTQYNSGDSSVHATLDYFFKQLSNPAVSGLIIDVRGNGGGSTQDLNFLIGSLISSPLHIGYTRSKSGSGRLDYTPWADAIVTPRPGFSAFTKPIVALADGESASMAELTTMSLRALSKTTFVGDTTWGANGPLTQNVDYNAGTFNFGNIGTAIETGTTYYYGNAYTSSCMFKYIDGNVYEGKGFPPNYDVKVSLDQIFLPNNMVDDPQLDKAIRLLPK